MDVPAGRTGISMRRWAITIAVLICIVVVFLGIRITTDVPHVVGGTTPADDFAERYVAHPWIGYGHMLPGAVYLLGAPWQLSHRFRARHYVLHRRMGRLLVTCALVSGMLALALGLLFAWGGASEASASVAFGGWFLFCLTAAVRAIRTNLVAQHRRWMIRAFAVSIGIATIRIWVGIFTGIQIGVLGFDDVTFPIKSTFGLAFWLGLGTHVLVGEWWLRRTPALQG